MKRVCPVCGKESEWEIVRRNIELNIKGEDIPVETEYYRCGECQTEFEDLNSDCDPYSNAYDEYRRRKGMVQPTQIREFRNRYNLTQKELSNLLGFGEVTLSRYENGALQDEVHDKLLRLAMEPQNLLRLLSEKPSAISEEKKSELLKQIKGDNPLIDCVQDILSRTGPNEFNGYRILDLRKITQIIRFFCYNREVFKSKLFKLLFYVDFKNYKLISRSITGLQYAHVPFGPVPDNYDLVIGAILQTDPNISMQPRKIARYWGDIIISKYSADMAVFTDEERKVLIEVNTKFEYYTSKQISFKSHNEEGYKETSNGDLIPYSYAMQLKI
jgi:putative zinc finger/helix-turn-helix YgiT family protein